jgi:hypothetical protein
MSISSIELTPKKCAALLEAIVDCDPELYSMIENCAKEYTDNPEQYDQDEEMMKMFYKRFLVESHEYEINDIKHEGDSIIISWYYKKIERSYQHEYNVKTKRFTHW